MKHNDLLWAVERCRLALQKHTAMEARKNPQAVTHPERTAHCLWMLDTIAAWPANRIEKAFRWLGFVQGFMWANGYATVDEMRDWNRPPATFDDRHPVEP